MKLKKQVEEKKKEEEEDASRLILRNKALEDELWWEEGQRVEVAGDAMEVDVEVGLEDAQVELRQDSMDGKLILSERI